MPSIPFSNGVTLTLSIQNGLYLGIEEARLDGEIFLVAGRGSRPYCVTPDGITYNQFRVLDRHLTEGEGEGITLECEAVGYAAPLQQRVDMFGLPILSHQRRIIHFDRQSLGPHSKTEPGFPIAVHACFDRSSDNPFEYFAVF